MIARALSLTVWSIIAALMGEFAGGSPWAMARDIAEGYVTVTVRTVRRLGRPQVQKLEFELERRLRSIRGDQPPLDDVNALRDRNRRLGRITAAQRVLRVDPRKGRLG